MNHDTNNVADPSPISRPLLFCPTCRSRNLEPVVEAVVEEVHFRCRDCGRCWDVELGTIRRVAPPSCLGCPRRGWCDQVYAADHPEHPGTRPPADAS